MQGWPNSAFKLRVSLIFEIHFQQMDVKLRKPLAIDVFFAEKL
jgi:hypothetical protein